MISLGLGNEGSVGTAASETTRALGLAASSSRSSDSLDFYVDHAADTSDLGVHVDDFGMVLAICGRQVGALPGKPGLLLAQFHQQRLRHPLAQKGDRSARLRGSLATRGSDVSVSSKDVATYVAATLLAIAAASSGSAVVMATVTAELSPLRVTLILLSSELMVRSRWRVVEGGSGTNGFLAGRRNWRAEKAGWDPRDSGSRPRRGQEPTSVRRGSC